MYTAAAALALVAGTNALSVPRGDKGCCFKLSANGHVGGYIGQLFDGQNRIGDHRLPEGYYCIDEYGGLYDHKHRGCILTPPTTQWQCDVGASPTLGFSIKDGKLCYKDSDVFNTCPTGDHGAYNFYTAELPGQGGCEHVNVFVHPAEGWCVPKPTPKPVPSPKPKPPVCHEEYCKNSGRKTCPTQLIGDWEFPHLIVPIDKERPNKAFGTSYNGLVSSTVSSTFNFDINKDYEGKTCSLVFLFPEKSQLETADYEIDGCGDFKFSWLEDTVDLKTSYNTCPKAYHDLGIFNLKPGNSYTIATFDCPADRKITFEMEGIKDSKIWWFQDFNPSPLGLYITVC